MRRLIQRILAVSPITAVIGLGMLVTCGGDTDDRTTRGATSLSGSAGVGVSEPAATIGAGGDGGAGGGIAMGGAGGNPASCDSLPSGDCYACCEGPAPAGVASFESAFMVCGCADCQLDCAQSLCGGGALPSASCVSCASQSIAPAGSCGQSPDFDTACTDDLACNAFATCVAGC